MLSAFLCVCVYIPLFNGGCVFQHVLFRRFHRGSVSMCLCLTVFTEALSQCVSVSQCSQRLCLNVSVSHRVHRGSVSMCLCLTVFTEALSQCVSVSPCSQRLCLNVSLSHHVHRGYRFKTMTRPTMLRSVSSSLSLCFSVCVSDVCYCCMVYLSCGNCHRASLHTN